MSMAAFGDSRSDLDQLVERFFGSRPESKWPTGGYEVPTDVFHTEDRLVISLDLPGVNPDEVEGHRPGERSPDQWQASFPA